MYSKSHEMTEAERERLILEHLPQVRLIARRIQERGALSQPPEPLRLPAPLSRLPWDIAQDEFGVQGADFIGVMGALLLQATQDQSRAYRVDSKAVADPLPPPGRQDQMQTRPQ